MHQPMCAQPHMGTRSYGQQPRMQPGPQLTLQLSLHAYQPPHLLLPVGVASNVASSLGAVCLSRGKVHWSCVEVEGDTCGGLVPGSYHNLSTSAHAPVGQVREAYAQQQRVVGASCGWCLSLAASSGQLSAGPSRLIGVSKQHPPEAPPPCMHSLTCTCTQTRCYTCSRPSPRRCHRSGWHWIHRSSPA
jgi:hypothetical protein